MYTYIYMYTYRMYIYTYIYNISLTHVNTLQHTATPQTHTGDAFVSVFRSSVREY